eukprot:13808482-Alexandrium_andersonii.AAC.1
MVAHLERRLAVRAGAAFRAAASSAHAPSALRANTPTQNGGGARYLAAHQPLRPLGSILACRSAARALGVESHSR